MSSKRETILAALHARLQTLAPPVLRGDVLPERIPATGLIILRDGKPGDPEVTLSPMTYFYEHRAGLGAMPCLMRWPRLSAQHSRLIGHWAGYAIGSRRKRLSRSIYRLKVPLP